MIFILSCHLEEVRSQASSKQGHQWLDQAKSPPKILLFKPAMRTYVFRGYEFRFPTTTQRTIKLLFFKLITNQIYSPIFWVSKKNNNTKSPLLFIHLNVPLHVLCIFMPSVKWIVPPTADGGLHAACSSDAKQRNATKCILALGLQT